MFLFIFCFLVLLWVAWIRSCVLINSFSYIPPPPFQEIVGGGGVKKEIRKLVRKVNKMQKSMKFMVEIAILFAKFPGVNKIK